MQAYHSLGLGIFILEVEERMETQTSQRQNFLDILQAVSVVCCTYLNATVEL